MLLALKFWWESVTGQLVAVFTYRTRGWARSFSTTPLWRRAFRTYPWNRQFDSGGWSRAFRTKRWARSFKA